MEKTDETRRRFANIKLVWQGVNEQLKAMEVAGGRTDTGSYVIPLLLDALEEEALRYGRLARSRALTCGAGDEVVLTLQKREISLQVLRQRIKHRQVASTVLASVASYARTLAHLMDEREEQRPLPADGRRELLLRADQQKYVLWSCSMPPGMQALQHEYYALFDSLQQVSVSQANTGAHEAILLRIEVVRAIQLSWLMRETETRNLAVHQGLKEKLLDAVVGGGWKMLVYLNYDEHPH